MSIINRRRNTWLDPTSASTQQRWLDSSIVIYDDNVIITPVESNEMYCLSLTDGTPKWNQPVKRGDSLFVACIHDGIVWTVGERAVSGYDLATSRRVRYRRLSAEGEKPNDEIVSMPSGRGFRSGNYYYLPTTRRIIKFDLKDGTIADAIRTKEPLGNLIAYKSHIISVGLDKIEARYQLQRLERIVDKRLAENPDDAWALEQHGLLLLDLGQEEEGLAALRKSVAAYPIDSPDRARASQELASTVLKVLEREFEANRHLLEEASLLVERTDDVQRFLLIRGNGLLRAGESKLAFDAYLDLIAIRNRRLGNSLTYRTATLSIDVGAGHDVRQDRIVRAGIRDALARSAGSQRDEMLSRIQSICDQALASDDIDKMIEFIRLFGDLKTTARLRIMASSNLVQQKKYLVAEQLLLPLMNRQIDATESFQSEAHLIMARIFTECNLVFAAANCCAAVTARWPHEKLADGRTVKEEIARLSENPDAGSPA